jgi:uncharacterized membrane protein
MGTEGGNRWFVLIPVALFAWAGAVKLIDPFAMIPAVNFVFNVLSWSPMSASDAAIVIGALELAVAAMLLIFPTSRTILLWSIVLLAVYTVVLGIFLVSKNAPSCGCLGARLAGRTANLAGITRNLGTIFLLGWMLGLGRAMVDSQRATDENAAVMRGGARAFTLIEALVVCMVIGILTAIVFAAIGKARTAARDVKAQATLHHLSLAVHAYTDDFRDQFPFTAEPRKPWLGVTLPGLPYPGMSYFGGQSATYVNLLTPHYFADRASIDTPGDYGARSREAQSFVSPYMLTFGAFAPNAYWVGERAPDDLGLYRGATRGECVFPANKAMLIHMLSGMYANPANTSQWLVIGSRMDGSALSTVLSPDFADRLSTRPYGCQPIPFMATQGGLAGRDF